MRPVIYIFALWSVISGCDRLQEYGSKFTKRFRFSDAEKNLEEGKGSEAKQSNQEVLEYAEETNAQEATDTQATQTDELAAMPDTPPSSRKTGGIQIGQVETIEGSSYFSLRFSCSVRRSEDDYQSYGKCQVTDASAQQYISIEPEMQVKVVGSPDYIQIIGSFQPDKQYRVTLKPGLLSKSGDKLEKLVRRTIRTPSYKKSFQFTGKARYFPRVGTPRIEFESRNIADVSIQVEKIHSQNIVYWLTKNTEASSPDVGEKFSRKNLKLKVTKNSKYQNAFALAEINSGEPGVFSVSAWAGEPGNSAQFDRTTFVYTDIAAVVKQDDAKLRVWTRSMRSFEARGAVAVRAVNIANRELANCVTSGIDAACDLIFKEKDANPYALILEAENDVSFLRFSDLEINHSRFTDGLRPFTNEIPLEAYVYSSQGVYRPGDIVNVAAVIRSTDKKPATDLAIKWRLINPQSKVLRLQTASTNGHGMVEFNFASADFASTGKYGIEVMSGDKVLGSHSFLIEEIVPERVAIKISDESKSDSVKLATKVQANYLFGPPVSSAPVKTICKLSPLPHSISAHPGFVTGLVPKGKMSDAAVIVSEHDSSLNEDGSGNFDCDYAASLRANNAPALLELAVAVSEAGSGRKARRTFRKNVASTNEYLGLRVLSRPGDKSISIETRLFNIEGKQIEGTGNVDVALFRLESNWLYSYDEEVGYSRWKSEDILIPESKVETKELKDGKLTHQWKPSQDWGRYLIQVEDKGRHSLAQAYFTIGYNWWSGTPNDGSLPAPKSPDEFLISGPSTPIPAGNTISIDFEAPFSGWALFTTETFEITSSKWQQVERGKGKVEVTAPNGVPNFYVSAILLKNPMEGEIYIPARAWGAASLKIDNSEHHLQIAIKAPEKMRSNRKLPIEITVSPPSEASVSLAVVDEGILQLTDFKTPHPEKYFDEDRQLLVKTFETIGWTFSRRHAMKSPGGDESGVGSPNGRTIPVKLVSVWPGIQKTDKKGRLTIEVDVPVFQGKLRVMAVASNSKGSGSAESATTVADPLALQPTLPRFLTHEDKFEIPVQVINTTDRNLKVEIKANVNDRVVLDRTTETIVIKKQSPAVVKFNAQVSAFDGDAHFTIEASSGKFSTTEKISIPIIPATPEIYFTKQMRLSQDFDVSSMVPMDIRGGRILASLSVSNMPYITGLSRITELARYPYGCIEQTTSATFPLLAMNELSPWLKTLDEKLSNINEYAQSGIARVISMQTGSGGFGYWPGDSNPVFWGSVYATHMLITAKSFGYSIPDEVIDSATKYLVDELRGNEIDQPYVANNYARRVYRDSEPYAQYVLALAGKPQAGRLRELATKPSDFWLSNNAENRFLVSASLQRIGETKLAVQTLEQWQKVEPAAYKKRMSEHSFLSRRRTEGMRLTISEDLWPGAAATEPLAMQVAESLASTPYLSTQEMAWSITGLAKRAKTFKAADVQSVQLLGNGKEMAAEFKEPQAISWNLSSLDIKNTRFQIRDSGGKAGDALVIMNGQGFAQDYSQPEGPKKDFTISRNYRTLNGDILDLNQIRQGDMIVIELKIQSVRNERTPNVAIIDRLPAGLEIENPRLGQGLDFDMLIGEDGLLTPNYFDIRDDRIHLFVELTAKNHRYYYIARAITNGQFTIPPAKVEAMYEPEQQSYSSYSTMKISP